MNLNVSYELVPDIGLKVFNDQCHAFLAIYDADYSPLDPVINIIAHEFKVDANELVQVYKMAKESTPKNERIPL